MTVDGKARVIIMGGGARVHALAVALEASPSVGKVILAPGTTALERRGFTTAPVASMDFAGMAELAELEEADLTVVVSNSPLVDGVVDVFDARDLPIFGPTRAAAKLEGSKSFARMLMNQLRMPTPRFAVCQNADSALSMAKRRGWPRVFKADGIAFGHGVRVVDRPDEVEKALEEILEDNVYGLDNARFVVEERLTGREVTVFSVTDGEEIFILGHVDNHPRLYDGDTGPPTRGMGQLYPSQEMSAEHLEMIASTVLRPTIAAMRGRGTPMRGALFVDLMMTERRGPVVIDFNVRFGDPATQILMTARSGDFYAVLQACRGVGSLKDAVASLEVDARPRVSIVVAARGYPDRRERGARIELDEAVFAEDDLWLFEDGMQFKPAGGEEEARLLTTGGRTATVVAAGDTIEEARERAYAALREGLQFEGMHYRRDIGA